MKSISRALFLFSLSLCLGAEAADPTLIVAQGLPGRLPGTLPGQQPPAAAKPAAAASPTPKTEIPAACCDITAIDKAKSVVSARERASGRIVEFKVGNSALLQKVHAGQAVHANFNTKQVSVDGKTMCCTITSIATPPTVASKTPAQSLPPTQKAPQAQPLPKVASTDPPKTLGAPQSLPGQRLPGQPPASAPAPPTTAQTPLPSRAPPAAPPKTSGPLGQAPSRPAALSVDVAGAGPQLSVRGQQAVLTWRAEQGSELRVNYGPTSALGRSATGRVVAGPPGLPTNEAILEGLQTGRPYYYSAVLSRNASIVSQTEVRPFSTPHVLVRVRPHRLDIVKDGDKDINGTNKGEAHFSWRLSLDPMSMTWPDDVMYGGCYPGGGTWTVGVPTTFTVPLAKYDVTQNPPGHNPAPTPGQTQPQNPYYPPSPMVGCVEDGSNPWVSKTANTVKVKSGQMIELRADAQEWVLPDGMPRATTVTASASTRASRPDGSLSGGGAAPTARRRPENRDTDTPVGGSGNTGASAPPAPLTPCEIREPRSAVVAIYAGTKGYEIDEIYNPTGPSKMRIRTQAASGSGVVCFDLREPKMTKMLGVKAKQGNFQFTTWFQVELLYRP